MKPHFLPQALIAFITMLLVVSCGMPDPNIYSARTALGEADYEEVIEHAQAAIESNPENGDGYYYMGTAYASIALEKPPDERKEYYRKARENFEQARKLYDEQGVTSEEAGNLNNIIIDLWGSEHNEGVQPLADNIMATDEDSLKLSHQHLTNAITINPDSVQSFNLFSEVKFALGDLEGAEELTRTVIYDLEKADLFNYYRLSHFLRETDRGEEAIEVLEEARALYPDEIEVIQEMANVYLDIGDTDQALEVVQELIERDPENPQFRLVYATQVYQMVEDLDRQVRDIHDDMYDISRELRQKQREADVDQEEIEQMMDELDRKEEEAAELIEESFRFSEQAEEELLFALEKSPENPDIHGTLGIIYQNRAAVLFDQRNMADDQERADEFDAEAREYLNKAIPYYERALEIDENAPEYWQSLYRVYITLGMQDEAERVQERSGL